LTGVPLSAVHKTGLGSSAALITSLVAGLLLHFTAIPRESFGEVDGEGRRLAHNLSQYVHCLAQGKVGSGFDVASAVFGSQLYTRFDPAVLHGLMGGGKVRLLDFLNGGKPHNGTQLRGEPTLPIISPSNAQWNYRVQPFKLPPLTRLMLADVDAGSDTPSLVGKVLKWREEKAEEGLSFWPHTGKHQGINH
jgi:phosphomevalonate kinase